MRMSPGLIGGEDSSVRCGSCITMAVAALAVAVCAVLIASETASANPIPSRDTGTPVIVGLILIFLMNLPVNVFWYSTFVLAMFRAKVLEPTLVPAFSGGAIAGKALWAAIVVSALGALIDVFSGEDDIFWFKEIGETTAIALVLVFVSVVTVSMVIPRLTAGQSLLVALLMVLMNLIHWTLIAAVFYGGDSAENPAPYVISYGIICAVLSVCVYRLLSRVEPPDTSLDLGSAE